MLILTRSKTDFFLRLLTQAYEEVEAEEVVLGGGDDVGGCVGAWSEAGRWEGGGARPRAEPGSV